MSNLENLYNEINNGDYGYTARWDSNSHVNEFGTRVQEENRDEFHIQEVSFQSYKNDQLVAFWTENYRGDDWDEFEEIINATVDEIDLLLRNIENGAYDGRD